MTTRRVCKTCDAPIGFVPYTSTLFPGREWCSVACLCRYEQAKKQHDQALRLQPVIDEEGDRCYCGLCLDDG